jgi:hypothetical protein
MNRGTPHPSLPTSRPSKGPVTPEVAGSSPVAPVESPCKSAFSVVCTGANDRRPAHSSRADTSCERTSRPPVIPRRSCRRPGWFDRRGFFGVDADPRRSMRAAHADDAHNRSSAGRDCDTLLLSGRRRSRRPFGCRASRARRFHPRLHVPNRNCGSSVSGEQTRPSANRIGWRRCA